MALKMVKVADSMDRTISEQEKLTPRRKNLAIRTRAFTFCIDVSVDLKGLSDRFGAYQICCLLLFCERLLLLQSVFFFKSWAEDVSKISWWSTRRLHSAFQWALERLVLHSWVVIVVGIGHLHRLMLVDIAKAHV